MPQNLASDVVIDEEQPTIVVIPSVATNVLGMVGISQRGPVAKEVVINSWPEFQKVFGDDVASSDACLAVRGFFLNGGTELRFVRTVHFADPSDPTTKTSAQGSLALVTANATPTAGAVTSSNTSPFALNPGDTLVLKVDGGGTQTTTFNATAAVLTSGVGTYNIPDNATLTFTIDGGVVLTKIFSASEFANNAAATAAEVVASLNAFLAAKGAGAVASVSAGAVRITSNRKGTGSHVHVTGGTANAGILAFSTVQVDGTGNVSNIAAVTVTEAIALLVAAGATASNVGGELKVASNTTGGSSSIQFTNASTAAAEFGFDNAIHSGGAGGTESTLTVKGKTDGAYAGIITTQVAAATSGAADHFNLYVLKNGVVAERWPNLSMNPAAPDYALTQVNNTNTGSDLIVLVDDDSTLPSPQNIPALGTFGPLAGGGDGLVSLGDNDFIGASGNNGDTGIRALDEVNTLALLCVPGRSTASVHNAMITYCEVTRAGSVFSILDPPANQNATEIVDYVQNQAHLSELSEFAAMYWPRIVVDNPNPSVFGTAKTITAPPSGHLAGMYARNDNATPSGVFNPPAGTDNGKLFGVRDLEMPEVKKKAKREIVFPALINPISTEPGQPIFVDGARTLKTTGNFPTIGERRGVIFLETSLRQGLAFMRHKNIQPRLLNEGRRTSFAFLEQQCRNNAFATTDPNRAFFVDFGTGINTPLTSLTRTVYGKIGIATAKPAEFVVLLVSQDTRALDDELAQAVAA